MCAILDNDRIHQVFGANRPAAGRAFFDWIDSGRGHLVVGGELRRELDDNCAFREWRRQAVLAGRITLLKDEAVDYRSRQLKQEKACRSNDTHVVAVAQLSGARLLYTNDGRLQGDFRDKNLIDLPRGRVYSTRCHDDFTQVHQKLLANRNLCARRKTEVSR